MIPMLRTSHLCLAANPGRAIRQLKGVVRWHIPVQPDDPSCRVTVCGKILQGATHYSSDQTADCALCLRIWQERAR